MFDVREHSDLTWNNFFHSSFFFTRNNETKKKKNRFRLFPIWTCNTSTLVHRRFFSTEIFSEFFFPNKFFSLQFFSYFFWALDDNFFGECWRRLQNANDSDNDRDRMPNLLWLAATKMFVRSEEVKNWQNFFLCYSKRIDFCAAVADFGWRTNFYLYSNVSVWKKWIKWISIINQKVDEVRRDFIKLSFFFF